MTNEDAIYTLDRLRHIEAKWPGTEDTLKAIEMAIRAIRAVSSNEPLTLDQLRCMDGKPVWIERIGSDFPEDKEWALVFCKEKFCRTSRGNIALFGLYGIGWLAYAYPPANIDREAWEPCIMCGGEKTLYQRTNTTKLFMNTFGAAATLVTECVACPPYADCCMQGVPANSAFKINFCPECGRPLTDEAWAEMEKRLMG